MGRFRLREGSISSYAWPDNCGSRNVFKLCYYLWQDKGIAFYCCTIVSMTWWNFREEGASDMLWSGLVASGHANSRRMFSAEKIVADCTLVSHKAGQALQRHSPACYACRSHHILKLCSRPSSEMASHSLGHNSRCCSKQTVSRVLFISSQPCKSIADLCANMYRSPAFQTFQRISSLAMSSPANR
jgi:hypothetical protein